MAIKLNNSLLLLSKVKLIKLKVSSTMLSILNSVVIDKASISCSAFRRHLIHHWTITYCRWLTRHMLFWILTHFSCTISILKCLKVNKNIGRAFMNRITSVFIIKSSYEKLWDIQNFFSLNGVWWWGTLKKCLPFIVNIVKFKRKLVSYSVSVAHLKIWDKGEGY